MTVQLNGSGGLSIPSVTTVGYQIGSSVIPTRNFVFSVPGTPDGTMKLARGNIGATTQDIFSVDASGNLTISTGQLLLSGNASAALGAVTKQQFDNLVVTFGVVAGNVGAVYPPAGYAMSNLMGFIPSMNQIHFNGDVDNNDSIYCYANYYSDRVDIVVFTVEQRSTPYANYIAIWKK